MKSGNDKPSRQNKCWQCFCKHHNSLCCNMQVHRSVLMLLLLTCSDYGLVRFRHLDRVRKRSRLSWKMPQYIVKMYGFVTTNTTRKCSRCLTENIYLGCHKHGWKYTNASSKISSGFRMTDAVTHRTAASLLGSRVTLL